MRTKTKGVRRLSGHLVKKRLEGIQNSIAFSDSIMYSVGSKLRGGHNSALGMLKRKKRRCRRPQLYPQSAQIGTAKCQEGVQACATKLSKIRRFSQEVRMKAHLVIAPQHWTGMKAHLVIAPQNWAGMKAHLVIAPQSWTGMKAHLVIALQNWTGMKAHLVIAPQNWTGMKAHLVIAPQNWTGMKAHLVIAPQNWTAATLRAFRIERPSSEIQRSRGTDSKCLSFREF